MTELKQTLLWKISDLGTSIKEIQTILLVGSYARNSQKEDSDIDLMIITKDKNTLTKRTEWLNRFGKIRSKEKEFWGPVTSLRIFYDDYEIEFGIAPEQWLALPLDEGTEQVLSDGYVVLYDGTGITDNIKALIKEKPFPAVQ